MSNNRFSQWVCDALKAIDGFTIEELPRLHTYPADASERVFKELYYERLSANMDECFHDEMLKAVLRNDTVFSLGEIARKFKLLGMNRDHMYELLESLRSETETEAQEDAILDLMDFLFGYCHPAWKIF